MPLQYIELDKVVIVGYGVRRREVSMTGNRFLMGLSGVLALAFWLVANCTDYLLAVRLLSGFIQIGLNVIVFVIYLVGLKHEKWFWGRFVAYSGVVTPPVMAGITIYRVILPGLLP